MRISTAQTRLGFLALLMSFISFSAFSQVIPPNDDCADAIKLYVGDVDFGTTLNATADVAPDCNGVSVQAPGVWYIIQGHGDMLTAEMCTFGATYDARISVYTGDCGNLTCVTADDNGCGPVDEPSVSWMSQACETYYVLVHGTNGETGDFIINISSPTLSTISNPVTADDEICLDETTTLSGTGSSTDPAFAPLTYSWAPAGDLSAPTAATTTFDPSAPGTYVFTLTVTDAQGCTDENTVQVIVNDLPVVSFTQLPDSFCIDDPTFQIAGSPSGGTLSGPGIEFLAFDTTINVTSGTETESFNGSSLPAGWTSSNNIGSTSTNAFWRFSTGSGPGYGQSGSGSLDHTGNGGYFAWVDGSSPYPAKVTLQTPLWPAGEDIAELSFWIDQAFSTSITTHNIFSVDFWDGASWNNDVFVHQQPTINNDWQQFTVDVSGFTTTGDVAFRFNVDKVGTTFPFYDDILLDDISYTYLTGDTIITPLAGVTDVAVFNPATAGVGTHTVSYTYTDANGCTNVASQTVVVNPLPVVGINGLAAEYCVDDAPVNITGSPLGGVLSGPGLTSTIVFDTIITFDTTFNNKTVTSGYEFFINSSTAASPINIWYESSRMAMIYTAAELSAMGLTAGDVITDLGWLVFSPPAFDLPDYSIDLLNTSSLDAQTLLTSGAWTNVKAPFLYSPTPGFTGNPATDNYDLLSFDNPYTWDGTSNLAIRVCWSPAANFSSTGQNLLYQAAASPQGYFTRNDGVDMCNLGNTAFSNGQMARSAFQMSILEPTITSDTNIVILGGADVAQFTPATAGVGTHDIIYTYTDPNGCTNADTQQVTVVPLPVVSFTGIAATPYCVSDMPFTLTGNPLGGTFSGAGVTDLGGGIGEFAPLSLGLPGDYTVYYDYTDPVTGCSNVDSQTVTIISTDNDLCENAIPVQIGDVVSGTTECSTIDIAPFCVVAIEAPGVWYTVEGTARSITLDLCNIPGTTYDTRISVYSGDCNNLVCVAGNDDGPACGFGYPSTVTFNSGACETYYILIHGDNNITGDFVMTVSGSLNNITADAGADQAICADESATLGGTPTASGGNPGYTYSWAPAADLSNAAIANPTFTPSAAGTYTYIVTVTDNTGCTDEDTVVVTVNPLPVLSIPGLQAAYCIDEPFTVLQGSPAGGTFTGTAGIINLNYGGTPYSQTLIATPQLIPDNDPVGLSVSQTVTVPGTALGVDLTLESIDVVVDHNWLGDIYFEIENPAGTTVTLFNRPIAGTGSCSADDINASFVWGTTNPADDVCVFTIPSVTGDVNASAGNDVNALNDGSNPNGAWEFTIRDVSAGTAGFLNSVTLNFSTPGVAFDPATAGAGTHTITYDYTDPNGCSATLNQQVVVNPLPVVSFTGLDPFYCFNGAIDTLVGTPAGGVFSGPGINTVSSANPATCSYTIDMFDTFGDGWNGASLDVFVNGSFVGNYAVTGAFGTPAGSFNSGTFLVSDGDAIEIFFNSGAWDSEIIFDIYDPSGALVHTDGPNPTIGLNFATTSTSSGCGILYRFTAAQAGLGEHTIFYTYVDANGCSNVDSQTTVVNPEVIVDAGADATICANEEIELGGAPTATGGTGPLTYVWTPSNGLDDATAANPTFDPPTAGAAGLIYTFDVVATDSLGCSETDQVEIFVDTIPTVILSGLQPTYCVDDECDTLTGFPAGGTFAGPGVVAGGGGGPATPLCDTTLVPQPGQTGQFSNTRGHWFTSPVDMVITSLEVPPFVSGSQQAIQVLLLPGTPPAFPGTTGGTTLFYTNSAPAGNKIPVNIPVSAGDVIGIVGGNHNGFGNITTNYGPAGPYTSVIAGVPTVMTRFGNQSSIVGGQLSAGFWQEPAGSFGKIDWEYEICSQNGVPEFPITVTQCNDEFNGFQSNPITSLSLSYSLTGAGAPTGDGELIITALGDLDGTGGNLEQFTIFDENGNFVGIIGATGNFGDQCSNISNTISIPQATIAGWAADGVINFTALGSSAVSTTLCAGDFVALNLVYCEGTVQTVTYECDPYLFEDTGLPVPVPPTGTGGFGSSPTVRTINVTGVGGTIGQTLGADVQLDAVALNISHTWQSDLDVFLTAPNGATITLWEDAGSSLNDFDVIISDNATQNIGGATGQPITGTYRAEGGFMNQVFAGSAVDGNWTLEIFDDAGGDLGQLNDFSLEFISCAVPGPSVTLFCPDSAGVGVHDITYTWVGNNGCENTDTVTVEVFDLPTVTAGPDTMVCRGESVTLTASASGTPGPYTYMWMPDTFLNTSMGPVVVATPDSTTVYTIIAVDSNGCSNFTELELIINQLPEITLDIFAGADSACYGDTVCINASVAGYVEGALLPELMYFKFDQSGSNQVPNEASSPVGNNPVDILGALQQTGQGMSGSMLQGVGGSSATNYVNTNWVTNMPSSWTIGFWLSNAPNNFTTSWTVMGDQQAGLQVTLTSPNGFGTPRNLAMAIPGAPDVIITDFSAQGNYFHYVYDANAGEVRGYLNGEEVASEDILNPQAITGAGPFKVGGSGNLAGMSSGMKLDEFRMYNKALTDQQILLTANYTQLSNAPTGLTYNWNTNGNPVAVSGTYGDSICVIAQNTGFIEVEVIDSFGCVNYDSIFIYANPEIFVDAGMDTDLCQGQSAVLGGMPTGAGGIAPLVYDWQPSLRLDSAGLANPTTNTLLTTNYTVTVTDDFGCSVTDEVLVRSRELPKANAGADAAICIGDSVMIGGMPAATMGAGPYTYSWAPATGLSSTTAANPMASPDTATNYTLTVTTIYGCVDDSVMRVEVYPLPLVNIDPVSDFCINDMPITLTAASMGGTWSGPGIVDAAAGIFDPAVAGAGTHTIMYENTSFFGCMDSSTIDITVNALPTVAITSPTGFCYDQGPTTLTANVVGGTWAGSGIVDPSGVFDPAVAGLGSHMVVLTFTDLNGCTNTDTAQFFVEVAPDATIDRVPDLCSSDAAITLTAVTAGGTWSGPGITNATAGTFNPGVAGPGVHTVFYSVTGPNGCVATDSVDINVAGLTNFAVNAAGPFCEEASAVILTSTVPGGYWSGPGVVNPLIGEFNPAVAGPGLHTVVYTFTNVDGCISIDSTQILVNGTPDATIALAGPFCANDVPATLSAATAGGTWSGRGITNASAGTFDPAVAGPGTHTITYNVTDPNGCSASASTVIKVNELPVISGTVIDVICPGDVNGKIDVSVEGGAPPYDFAWSNGATSLDLDEIAAGTYTLTVTDAKGCTETATFNVGTQSTPMGISAVITNATAPVYDNGAIDITVTGGTAPYFYEWSNGATTEDISGLRPDSFTVTVTDYLGCSQTISFEVQADFGLTVDLNDLSRNIELYPNPTSDVININIEMNGLTENLELTVFDVLGRRVYERADVISNVFNHSIDMSDMASGQYMIRFKIGDEFVTKKFVLTK